MDIDTRSAEAPSDSKWESTVEVRQLRAFLAVASVGSVSGAAATLGLAQSTVSEAIAALDRAIGTATISRRRGVHRVALTEAGASLLPHARRVLQEIRSAHRAITAVSRATNAHVTFTASESVSSYLLTPALGALRQRWPATRFSVSVATCAQVRAEVAHGRCDMGLILAGDGPASVQPDLDATRVGTVAPAVNVMGGIPLVIFCGAKHPLVRRQRRRALPLDSVAKFRMLTAEPADEFHGTLAKYFATESVAGVQFEPVGSVDAVKRGVRNDPTALGILPRCALDGDMESGKTREIRLLGEPPRVQLMALLPRSLGTRHPSMAELLKLLRCE